MLSVVALFVAAAAVLRPSVRDVSMRSMEIEDLEALEAEFLRGGRHMPPRLGSECGSYRWTQDATHIHVTVPLPSRPPHSDVSLVVAPTEFGVEVIFPTREFEGVRGALGGAVDTTKTKWHVEDDPFQGPRVRAAIRKERDHEMWRVFLVGEEHAPTVQFAGTCRVTGARFKQHRHTFDLEFDLPADVVEDPDRLRVDVTPTSFLVDIPDDPTWLPRRAQLRGRVVPEDTVWLVDPPTRTLDLALRKTTAVTWWPGLADEGFF
ncbi:hypothetical protein CTAYLR_009529 [Chrysophaeum taylorii]|uniref:CS domain-containing protein n=1 Tax=Chrysophaeum taylorii TaxID=2483200 RepID=A0AAD7XNX9_9STRA|nr:hypothetical protein CTAYLR_009529 [Chrysophaeum taylorii]